ncbi:MAG: AAA family ATPase, partial [Planctomycetaceae bacterium]|nr:AAA family ATPase [Planctomycetaceae bacterium]
MKNLPIGIQSFSVLRKDNYLYVDKTENILKMVTSGRIYFLSRPRRFGKSLLVSTLDELFSSNKNLFDGLFIFDKWDWSQKYPVIRLDFGARANHNPEALFNSLSEFIKEIATNYGVLIEKTELPDKFSELIQKIHQSTGQQVVILVDEYDKPITDHLSNIETLTANKIILHDFYQVLKASDDHIRFIFLTGVSKFSGVSVFSALNNVDDITLDRDYASICGYTQNELENCFSEYIDVTSDYLNQSRAELL